MTRLDLEKTAQGRSLRSLVGPGGEALVEKRFELPGIRGMLRNRRRARREAAALELLAQRGIPVPTLRGLRALGRGHHAVTMAEVPGAQTLEACLRNPEGDGSFEGVLDGPRALGRLLARAHLAGLDHPDLHPGNILRDRDGKLYLIDFHAARVAGPCRSDHRRRDLLNLEAALRQAWSPYRRMRAYLAWSRTSRPGESAPTREALRGEVRSIFLEARRKRLLDTRRRRRRYHRRSSSTRVVDLGVGGAASAPEAAQTTEAIEATELGSNWTLRFLETDRTGTPTHSTPGPGLALRTRLARDPDSTAHLVLVLEGGSEEQRQERFASAGQLLELGIPSARPASLVRGAGGKALLRLPAGSESLVDVRKRSPGGEPGPRRRRFAAGLGRLCGLVMDRGLSWERMALESFWVEPDGSPFLAGLSTPREGDTEAPDLRLDGITRWLEEFGETSAQDASRRERALFLASFLRAVFSSPASGRALRRTLRRGQRDG